MNPIQPEPFEYNWVSREKLRISGTRKKTRGRGAHRSLAPSLAARQKMESLLTGYHCSDIPSKVLKQLVCDTDFDRWVERER